MSVVTITEPTTYKLGSTWVFILRRKDPDDEPIDLGGLTIRSMFRDGAVGGAVKATLVEGDGVTVDAQAGQVTLTVDAESTATFTAGAWAYFDVEMRADDGHVWQSPTYRLKTEGEVTV